MTQFYSYKDAFGVSAVFDVTFDPDVVRLGELQGLVEMAEHLQAGTSTLVLDDPDADLGSGGDAIRAMARLRLVETAMAAGNQRLYTGIFFTRRYRRRAFSPDDSLRLGASREIECELHDLNFLMSLRVIPNSDRDAIRPAESVDDRMAWIMSTNYMNGVVASADFETNTTQMTKSDYRGQAPANVVGDCEMSAGFGWNAWVRWNEADAVPELSFINANTSTLFTSTLRLSNVYGDYGDVLDPATTTFGPSVDAELTRDPSDIGSGVYLPYQNGAVYRTSATTTDYYGRKDILAPNANVKSRARAQDQADDFLFQHATEEDRITCTVELPPDKVNLIHAGHRIQVRFQHLPGYETFTWCRVLMRSVGQKTTQDRYSVRLELSPQEIGCEENVEPTFIQAVLRDQTGITVELPQYSYTYDFASPTTIGNLLVVGVMSGTTFNSAVLEAPAGWEWPVQNERNQSGGLGHWCNVFSKISTGEDSITFRLASPGGTHRIALGEWDGLNGPAIYNAPSLNLQDPGTGNATTGNSYPAGPTAVISFCFMSDGPTGTDDLFVEVGTAELRTPIDGGLHGSADISISDMLLDTTAGSASWQLGNTGGGTTLSAALVFAGADCDAAITTPDPVPEGGGDPEPPPSGPAMYIAPTGDDDTGDGSLANPWLTVAKFVDLPPAPGDRLYCRGGTYTGTTAVTIDGVSGSSGSPITVAAYPGETPVFAGAGTGSVSRFASLTGGASYWTLDGLTFQDFRPGSSGVVWIGDATVSTHHIIVRNCHFAATTPVVNDEQQVYLSYHADDCTVENNIFVGATVGGTGGTGVNIGDHSPGPQRFMVRRNIFSNFGDAGAIWLDDSAANGSILHNTFLDPCNAFIRLVDYAAVVVQDNAGTHGTNFMGDIYDQDFSSGTKTIDHNFWGQTFDAGHHITAGAGIGGATDGGDAGAL